jgi:hypothetical protein
MVMIGIGTILNEQSPYHHEFAQRFFAMLGVPLLIAGVAVFVVGRLRR